LRFIEYYEGYQLRTLSMQTVLNSVQSSKSLFRNVILSSIEGIQGAIKTFLDCSKKTKS
jgi:hypothetical protein